MKLILKDKFPVIKVMTKGDFLLIAGIIILVAILFIKPFISNDNLYGEIYVDSQKVHTVYFKNISSPYTLTYGECELSVEKDGISFENSTCPDKLCVHSGKLSKSGDTMACVPQKVVVIIKSSKNSFDAVSY